MTLLYKINYNTTILHTGGNKCPNYKDGIVNIMNPLEIPDKNNRNETYSTTHTIKIQPNIYDTRAYEREAFIDGRKLDELCKDDIRDIKKWVRLISYNVHNFRKICPNGDNPKFNIDYVLDPITILEPDIFGMQEMVPNYNTTSLYDYELTKEGSFVDIVEKLKNIGLNHQIIADTAHETGDQIIKMLNFTEYYLLANGTFSKYPIKYSKVVPLGYNRNMVMVNVDIGKHNFLIVNLHLHYTVRDTVIDDKSKPIVQFQIENAINCIKAEIEDKQHKENPNKYELGELDNLKQIPYINSEDVIITDAEFQTYFNNHIEKLISTNKSFIDEDKQLFRDVLYGFVEYLNKMNEKIVGLIGENIKTDEDKKINVEHKKYYNVYLMTHKYMIYNSFDNNGCNLDCSARKIVNDERNGTELIGQLDKIKIKLGDQSINKILLGRTVNFILKYIIMFTLQFFNHKNISNPRKLFDKIRIIYYDTLIMITNDKNYNNNIDMRTYVDVIKKEMQTITEETKNEYVIIHGDFNHDIYDRRKKDYFTLLTTNFIDVMPSNYDSTPSGWQKESQIDKIFINEKMANDYEIFCKVVQLSASDHYPIMMDFRRKL